MSCVLESPTLAYRTHAFGCGKLAPLAATDVPAWCAALASHVPESCESAANSCAQREFAITPSGASRWQTDEIEVQRPGVGSALQWSPLALFWGDAEGKSLLRVMLVRRPGRGKCLARWTTDRVRRRIRMRERTYDINKAFSRAAAH